MAKEQGIVKKVLMYENRKIDPMFWDVSTSCLEQKAFFNLFNYLDKDWAVYSDLKSLSSPKKPSLTKDQIDKLPPGRVKETALAEHQAYQRGLKDYEDSNMQKKWYDLAKRGDFPSLMKLLKRRKEHEYEKWNIHKVD